MKRRDIVAEEQNRLCLRGGFNLRNLERDKDYVLARIVWRSDGCCPLRFKKGDQRVTCFQERSRALRHAESRIWKRQDGLPHYSNVGRKGLTTIVRMRYVEELKTQRDSRRYPFGARSFYFSVCDKVDFQEAQVEFIAYRGTSKSFLSFVLLLMSSPGRQCG